MEYLGMFGSYFATSIVTTTLILKNKDLVNVGRTIGQAVIISIGITIFTILFNMLRAYRSCDEVDGVRPKGFASGLKLSIWAVMFSMTIFVILNMTSLMVNIITIILPFLSNYVEFIKAYWVAIVALIGYWFGRIFTSLC
jgi:hypothetical protein